MNTPPAPEARMSEDEKRVEEAWTPLQTMTPIPESAPVLQAWNAYQLTDAYRNTRSWALKEAHVDGSLWASFHEGFLGGVIRAQEEDAGLQAAVAIIDQLAKERDEAHAELATLRAAMEKMADDMAGAIAARKAIYIEKRDAANPYGDDVLTRQEQFAHTVEAFEILEEKLAAKARALPVEEG